MFGRSTPRPARRRPTRRRRIIPVRAAAAWTIRTGCGSPYDAQIDKAGWVWTDNMMNDLVTRIDTKTGQAVQYLMPVETNGRRVAVDDYGTKPGLWIGANHQAVVMHVEP